MSDHPETPDHPEAPDHSEVHDLPEAHDRTASEHLLEPLKEVSDDQLPPRFADALTELRAAIARCHTAGIPEDTTLAALLVETMPRLVEAYGAKGAAAMLGQLTREISEAGGPQTAVQ